MLNLVFFFLLEENKRCDFNIALWVLDMLAWFRGIYKICMSLILHQAKIQYVFTIHNVCMNLKNMSFALTFS